MIRMLPVILITCTFILVGHAFGFDHPEDRPPLFKSSESLIVKLAVPPKPVGVPGDIAIPGGVLRIQTALIHLEEISIEDDDEDDGEDGSDGEDDNGGQDDEDDLSEIELKGPFSVDLSSDRAIIDLPADAHGTFTVAELEFKKSRSAPFNGHSVQLTGTFTSTDGIAVPFNIQSSFTGEIKRRMDSHLVLTGQSVPVSIILDFGFLFDRIPLLEARRMDGRISIDRSNNKDMLSMFEANIYTAIIIE